MNWRESYFVTDVNWRYCLMFIGLGVVAGLEEEGSIEAAIGYGAAMGVFTVAMVVLWWSAERAGESRVATALLAAILGSCVLGILAMGVLLVQALSAVTSVVFIVAVSWVALTGVLFWAMWR